MHQVPSNHARGHHVLKELSPIFSSLVSLVKKPPKMELKQQPEHLKYAYLGELETLPVIIASKLTKVEEKKLLRVLKEHKMTLGWTIADIKGISHSMCMHHIFLEDDVKPTRDHRLNPNMKEVVRKEILKLLKVGIIYPIFDSKCVSTILEVPKRSGITVVKNENNELIPMRLTTGW